MPTSPDEIELAAEAATEDWQDLTDPLTLPIEKLVDRAGSLAEVRDGLLELAGAMDVAPVHERLSQAIFSARLGGDAAVGQETARS